MEESLIVGVRLTVVGMIVVFMGLGILVILLSLFQRIDQWMSQPKTEDTPSTTVSPGALTPELVAALSAAAVMALGKPVRIHRIRYHPDGPRYGTEWARQGRLTVMGSHTVRR